MLPLKELSLIASFFGIKPRKAPGSDFVFTPKQLLEFAESVRRHPESPSIDGFVQARIVEEKPIPAGDAPFHHDEGHMYNELTRGWYALYQGYDSDAHPAALDYVILANTRTGQRLRICLEAVSENGELDKAMDALGMATPTFRLPEAGFVLLEKLTKHWEDEISFFDKSVADPDLVKDVNEARTYLDFGKANPNELSDGEGICEDAGEERDDSLIIAMRNQYNTALSYAIEHLDIQESSVFLGLWREGCWSEIQASFPDFPGLVTINGMLQLSDDYCEVKRND